MTTVGPEMSDTCSADETERQQQTDDNVWVSKGENGNIQSTVRELGSLRIESTETQGRIMESLTCENTIQDESGPDDQGELQTREDIMPEGTKQGNNEEMECSGNEDHPDGLLTIKIEDVVGNVSDHSWSDSNKNENTSTEAAQLREDSSDGASQDGVPVRTADVETAAKEGTGESLMENLHKKLEEALQKSHETHRENQSANKDNLASLLSCTVCGEASFPNRDTLRAHILVAHMDESGPALTMPSGYLAPHFAGLTKLSDEKSFDVGSLTGCFSDCVICPLCSEGFGTKFDCELHYDKVHAGKRTSNPLLAIHGLFKCTLCRTFVKCRDAFGDHMTTKHKLRTYCPLCDEFFSSVLTLNEHNLTAHPNQRSDDEVKSPYGFTCRTCGMKTDSLGEFGKHRFLHSRKTSRFMCHLCNRSFREAGLLTNHMRLHHERIHLMYRKLANERQVDHPLVTSFECLDCSKVFVTETEVKLHVRCHDIRFVSNSSPFSCATTVSDTCLYCGVNYLTASKLSEHNVLRHHLVFCSLCGTRFIGQAELDLHLRTEHNVSDDQKCSKCPLTFSNEKSLVRHEGRDHSTCPACNLFMKDKHTLCLHYAWEHASTRCSRCGQLLRGTQKLMLHKATGCHDNSDKDESTADANWKNLEDQKHLTCKMCSQICMSQKSLRSHMTVIHNTCEVCNEAQPNQAALRRHTERLHAPTKCNFCQTVVTGTEGLRKHVDTAHTDVWRCTECDDVFATETKLASHTEAHARGTLQRCDMCDKFCESLEQLQEHRRMHVSMKIISESKVAENTCDVLEDVLIDALGEDSTPEDAGDAPSTSSTSVGPDLPQEKSTHPSDPSTDNTTLLSLLVPGLHDSTAADASMLGHKSVYKCSWCSTEFSRKLEWDNHQRQHLRFICPVCMMALHTPGDLASHILYHPDSIRFQCQECLEGFVTRGQVYNHLITVHEQERKTADDMRCDACNITFFLWQKYIFHMLTTHPLETHCGKCKRLFVGKDALTSHQKKSHLNDKNTKLKCHFCDSVHSQWNLQAHEESHEQLWKRFKCRECSRLFVHERSRREHEASDHPGLLHFTHECTTCGELFLHGQDLSMHCAVTQHGGGYVRPHGARIHLNKRAVRLICSVCLQFFGSQPALDRHREKCHPPVKKVKTPQKPQSRMKKHRCGLCPAIFDKKEQFLYHAKKEHA